METYYDYLRSFASELGSRIIEMYPPLQGPKDPIAPELQTLLRKPLPAQEMTITGAVKYLKTANSVRIVGECGTGKTLMSIGIAHAHSGTRPYNAIAMCPPHLVLKWAREVLVTVPRARVFVLYDLRNGGDPSKPHGVVEMRLRNGHAVSNGLKTTLPELRRMGRKGWRKICRVPAYFIVSKETGKLSYFWKHAYTWSESGRSRLSVTNPDTGRSIPCADGGYLSRIDFADVKLKEIVTREKGGTEGHSALWQADRNKIQRMAPLEFISRYMKGWWDYSIADELHQLANETAQGNNLDVLRRCGRKLIALTGTMMGGYADDLFHIFYRMEPRKMVEEGFEAGSQGRGDFQATYGVLESIEKIPDADNACSRAAKSTIRVSRKPGASPLLFGKFLMSSTAFVTLEDIADYLPPYEETVHEISLDAELGQAYEEIEKDIRDALRENRGNRSLMSLILHRLLLYPDHPFGIGEIWAKRFDPQEGRLVPFLVTKAPELPQEVLYAKERELIADIREELRQGRRCQVYATFTGEHDVAGRLERVLRQAGFRVAVLRQTVPTLRRELWYEKQLKEGVGVVICHPKLVETGLDLLWFPTIYFYETGYSLHTLRQASRRSWRIGQMLGVRVKFFIYAATTQLTCLRLMGKKMLVALMLEGKFSGEGIHSMDTDDDMMAAMARELVEKGGVGQSADAIWEELKRERGTQAVAGPKLVEPMAQEENLPAPSLFSESSVAISGGSPGLTLVHSDPKPKKKPEVIWPTGSIIGEQMNLFG
ncbi:MAG TPA: DEAD/DEAH box helicase [Acidobacteriaceae bacterium]